MIWKELKLSLNEVFIFVWVGTCFGIHVFKQSVELMLQSYLALDRIFIWSSLISVRIIFDCYGHFWFEGISLLLLNKLLHLYKILLHFFLVAYMKQIVCKMSKGPNLSQGKPTQVVKAESQNSKVQLWNCFVKVLLYIEFFQFSKLVKIPRIFLSRVIHV